MVQCGLSIPIGDHSKVGIYQDLMIDIGDEQSLENDLSTYSSHLLNMKNMMRQASDKTLILIDEFGTGTEPQIGGAIAESVLNQFCRRGAWAVITTHYQNLKHFADTHEGVANGAMLYARHEMRPLFQLSIGRPGSSFAIEIARKIGLPEEVIAEASEIVGSDYIQSDKYLQDIVRDKRYWEAKRQTIHLREKELERTMQRYEIDLTDMERQRKEILRRAKDEAMQLLAESNKKIENTIREIKEKQAQKEETRNIRTQLNEFKQQVANVDTKAKDEEIARKIEQIKQRKERHQKHKEEKANRQKLAAETLRKAVMRPSEEDLKPKVGDTVRIKGLSSVGTLESIDGKMAVAIFGGMRTKLRLDRIEKHLPHPANGTAEQPANKTKAAELQESLQSYNMSHMTQETLDSHKRNFHQDLDVRGMRGDEALNAVQYFIDDAILVGMARVRILHGKGNGILRQLIRDYLAGIPNITRYADEHVQFGGAGITVVDIG
jgi:DNA mismatch repair protein MutS2